MIFHNSANCTYAHISAGHFQRFDKHMCVILFQKLWRVSAGKIHFSLTLLRECVPYSGIHWVIW